MGKVLYLLDMDGTLYLGDELFKYTLSFLKRIKESGGRYVFLTNNSSKGVESYIEKMSRFGIDTNYDDYFTSVDAAIALFENKTYKKIYALGTRSFVSQLKKSNMNISEKYSDDIDCLLIGYDTELSYSKLVDASKLLIKGVDYYATNPDWVCPTEWGCVPDCGSICEMLSHVNGRKPIFIGKPQPEMILLAMKKYGFSKEETVVIGDRIYTDVASGINAGVDSYFVLSGEGTLDDIEKYGIKPTAVFNNVGDIL